MECSWCRDRGMGIRLRVRYVTFDTKSNQKSCAVLQKLKN